MPGRRLPLSLSEPDAPATASGPRTPRWRRALVTGASSGIGRAFVLALAGAGSEIVLVARRQERLEALAAEVESACGTKAEVLTADVSDEGQLRAVERRLADGDRPVDLLVNSAGFGTHGPFAELPVEREEQEVLVNVLAPVRLTRAALPGMIDRGRGGIVNVSSIAGIQPLPRWATYGATKAYLTSFSQAVHEEVRDRGVTVLALMPGFTRSEFQDRSGSGTAVLPGFMWMSPDDVATSGLDALARGRATFVPGVGYRAFAAVSRVAPWALARRVVHRAGSRL
jgi:short-subunit dehydrogenase